MYYFLRLSYDGTHFRGWQRQPAGLVTVQAALENTLGEVLKREVLVGGCGRTDAGVHATQFYAGIKLREAPRPNLLFILNKRLPAGIAVHEIFPVGNKAQARYDATSRTYDYYLHRSPDVFLDRLSTLSPALASLNLDAVTRALQVFLRQTDYRAFCKTPDRHNTTICQLTHASLATDGDRLRLRFTANRFLRGMIRLLVHDLLAIGTGRLRLAELDRLFASGERAGAVKLAPPEGLYLTGVAYPYIDRFIDVPLVGFGDWRLV